MAKRIKITEQQLSVVINHLKENKDKELIEEGVKEWMLVGLMTLASAAGLKGQTSQVNSDHIKAAKMVQSKLDSGGKEMVKYFDKADIQLNRENLSALLKVDDEKIDTFKTKYLGTAKEKIKQGYVLKAVDVTSDTLIKELPKGSTIDTAIAVDLSGNLFSQGTFDLNPETASQLSDIIETIRMNGGKINYITIESSTDKQRISPELENDLIKKIKMGGNKGLSTLRYFRVKQHLMSLGIDKSSIRKDIKWDQGAGEMNSATPQDPSARYVRVIIDATYDIAPMKPDSTVGDVVNTVFYVLIKKGEEIGAIRNKGKSGSGKPKVKGSCKVDLRKIGSLKCPRKF